MKTNLSLRRGGALIVGLGAAGIAIRRWASGKPRSDVGKRTALVSYLREHLAASDGAVRLVDRLCRTQTDEQKLLDWLYVEFEADREALRTLLKALGATPLSSTGLLAQTPGPGLNGLPGAPPRQLTLLRALEALAIAVQRKLCLWRALQSLPPEVELPRGRDFAALESSAVRQWEAIERRRTSVAAMTLNGLTTREG